MAFSRQLKPSQLQPNLLYNITASHAVTASYAIAAGIPNLITSGSVSAQVYPDSDIFILSVDSAPILSVSASGVITLATQSAELTGSTLAGTMYFTSSSFFVGLE